MLAATNRPEICIPLLRRARFDRQVLVDRPQRGRLAILKVHVRKVHSAATLIDRVAALTAGFILLGGSGRQRRHLVEIDILADWILRTWTLRIASRPPLSGRSTST